MANKVILSIATQPAPGSVLAYNVTNGVFGYTVGITFVSGTPLGGNQCQIGANTVATLSNLYTVLQTSHNPSNVVYTITHPDVFIDFVIEDTYNLTLFNNAGGAMDMVTLSLDAESNNMIHEIIFTPRRHATPSGLSRNYLVTEDDYLILTEDNKKIRL